VCSAQGCAHLIGWAGHDSKPFKHCHRVFGSPVGTIYFAAVKLGFDKPSRRNARHGRCGMRRVGAIAVGGAVGREEGEKSPSPVFPWWWLWAIAMCSLLRWRRGRWVSPTVVAGAWIGTSSRRAAGLPRRSGLYGAYAGHVPGISGPQMPRSPAFTLMKFIGRDSWVGVWAVVLSISRTAGEKNRCVQKQLRCRGNWRRFPEIR